MEPHRQASIGLRLLSGVTAAAIIMIAVFGAFAHAMTRGRRDFTSVRQVVATRFEVLAEHKYAQQARDLLDQR